MILNFRKKGRAFLKLALFLATLPVLGFAFTSQYLSQYDIHANCDYILHKKAFDICYSCGWKTPKLVVYRVDGLLADSVNLSRKRLRFRPDYTLPTRCRSYPRDYSKTGFDRGHLAPNAAFDYDRRVQKETFFMSNIAPQKPKMNRRLWAKIERFVRWKAKSEGNISVVTGVCQSLGHIRNGVNIPRYWFKVIFSEKGKPVCFLVPNANVGMKKAKAKTFLSSLSEIERVCGIVFKHR